MADQKLVEFLDACVAAQKSVNERLLPYNEAKRRHDEARHQILVALKSRKKDELSSAFRRERETHADLTDAIMGLVTPRHTLEHAQERLFEAIENEAKGEPLE